VKTIVEAHAGAAWAQSTPGRGASFFFTLPSEASI
jgi:signal transduction histidine kinase